MKTACRIAAILIPVSLLLACGSESDEIVYRIQASSFADAEWSEPVNLGPTINTAANENNPTLSPDGLSLYFTSDRAGGLGLTDIWVSHRACGDCPWEAPVNLGSPINTASTDIAPSISIDGHLLFFASGRIAEGGVGDVYLSTRANPKDDFGWGAPVRLGPEVNTPAFDAGPEYMQSAEDGATNLYFGRQPVGGLFDIYMVAVTREGEIRGPAVPVSELNSAFGETGPTLRTDGREVLFFSGRPPTLGANDFWVSTRRSVHEPWSEPVHLDAPLSSAFNDRHPSLSDQGRTLVFASNRPGGFGLDDIWMSTRTH
jgi:WD40 repeat protein